MNSKDDRIEKLEQMLAVCAGTFRAYEALHAAKPDPVKAKANGDLAKLIEDLIN